MLNIIIIREMQIKTITRCHYTPVYSAYNIYKTHNTECWQGRRATETLLQCWWERELVQHFEKQFGSFLQS